MVMVRAPQNLVDGYGANSARSSHRKVARLKTQHLYGSAGTALLFRTPSRAPDSFISMPPYVQNEGMPEGGGSNAISGGTGKNTFVIPAAGAGTDTIAGFADTNGDVLDLRAALAAAGWKGSQATLSKYLKVS